MAKFEYYIKYRNKEEKLYRLEKAYNNLLGYTTLPDKDKFERVLEELLKVVASIVEQTNN